MTREEREKGIQIKCFGCNKDVTRQTMVMATVETTGNEDLRDIFDAYVPFCKECTYVDEAEASDRARAAAADVMRALDKHIEASFLAGHGFTDADLDVIMETVRRAGKQWEPGETPEAAIARTCTQG